MWGLHLVLVLLLAHSAVVFSECESTVAKSFIDNQIVPDIIPKAPEAPLFVTYPCGAMAEEGNELTPTTVRFMPKVWWEADENSYYTLVLTDPDALNRANHTLREWHHWLVGNIKGSEVETGETLSAYIGSAPSKDSGLHRYTFLVYEQKETLQFDEPRLNNTSIFHRSKFSIAKFAEKYQLGDPVAGNFYQAQWDEYVPILLKQLGVG